MRMHKIIETKRRALGLTQAELGRLAGVSGSTIAVFESGKEVSVPVFNGIKAAIEKEISALDKQEYLETMLMMHVLQIQELEEDEKLQCLSYIVAHASKLQLELMRS